MTIPSVLVVEDDLATAKALRRFFQLTGWEVRIAGSIGEALALLDPPPDCVILDLMLPDGLGEVVLRRIREGGLATRVIVCTGLHDSARLAALAGLGPDAILRKPVRTAEITRAVGPVGMSRPDPSRSGAIARAVTLAPDGGDRGPIG